MSRQCPQCNSNNTIATTASFRHPRHSERTVARHNTCTLRNRHNTHHSVSTVTQHQQCYSSMFHHSTHQAPQTHSAITQTTVPEPTSDPTTQNRQTQHIAHSTTTVQYLSCVKESSSSSSWMAVAAGEAAMLGCVTRVLPTECTQRTQDVVSSVPNTAHSTIAAINTIHSVLRNLNDFQGK
jgi:hypothetical protein